MLRLPLYLVDCLIDELTYQECNRLDDSIDIDILNITLMSSSNRSYFIGACLINYDYYYVIYTIDLISLRPISFIFESDSYWDEISIFNEYKVEVHYYGDSKEEDSSESIYLQEFYKDIIKLQSNPLNWSTEFIILYEGYIKRLMSKLTLFGKLYKVDFKGLHNVYYECYGNNSGTLHDLIILM